MVDTWARDTCATDHYLSSSRLLIPGGGDELVNRSKRDRAADDLGHRDVTRNLSREL